MYVRVTKTVADKGTLVHPDTVESLISDRKIDWYRSTYTYGDDALEYFQNNGGSIKGYTGDAWTDTLYWDLDCKDDFEKVRKAASKLLDKLEELKLLDATEVFFSGNKGVHILTHTTNKFSTEETSRICHNIAKDAGLGNDVFDTSVYNLTRIFRIPNTRHQESKLYKIPLDFEELDTLSNTDIRTIAKRQRKEEFELTSADAEILKQLYPKKSTVKDTRPTERTAAEVLNLHLVKNPDSPDFSLCPPTKRRCIYALEQGYIEPGKRHEAILRLAAHYSHDGYARDAAAEKIFDALDNRHKVYTGITDASDAENNRDIDEVFSEKWDGGTYTCKTDEYLSSKCDIGNGPCCESDMEEEDTASQVKDVDQLIVSYVDYGNEALEQYPQTGIPWIDERVRLRPRNYSIVNGANGSGKTSIAIEIMENWNRQSIWNIMFSLDMADTSLFEKLGAKYTTYSLRDIEQAFNRHTRNEQIMLDVAKAVKERLPLTLFDFTSSATTKYMEKTIKNLEYEKRIKLKAGIIDYIGRIPGPDSKSNNYAAATANALAFNDVVKRTDIHLIGISQISRENGDHTDPLRSSRVSKDSGAWEENATIIINCWRPFGDGLDRQDKYMHAYIAKNRSGSLGEHVFSWEGKTGSVRELDEKEFREYVSLCERHDKPIPYNQFPSREQREETISGEEAIKRSSRFKSREKDVDEEEVSSRSRFKRSEESS